MYVDLEKQLKGDGYVGKLKVKTGKNAQYGNAIFWKFEKYEEIMFLELNYSDIGDGWESTEGDGTPKYESFLSEIS